jgi:hypothetical protein
MNTRSITKPSKWFWIVSVLALLWNLLGVAAYLGEAYMKEEMMAAYTETQKNIMNGLPSWIMGAFAIAVFAGAIGCIALLMQKKWAGLVLWISLLAVLARTGYFFFMTNGTEVFSVLQGTVMPIITVVISALLVILARVTIDKGWLS